MAVKVAINGFGRIGRNVLRAIIESGRTDIEVVAINDLGPVETNAHLLRYDSVHGRFPATVTVKGDTIDVGRGPIKVTAIRNPADLPWGDVDVILEGRVELGDGVRIGPFCRLKDVTLCGDTEVRAHCDLDGVRAEGSVTIGPFARLRPGAALGGDVHVGNFVEVKNSVLDEGVKVGHLTYLGDADVGAGAGRCPGYGAQGGR